MKKKSIKIVDTSKKLLEKEVREYNVARVIEKNTLLIEAYTLAFQRARYSTGELSAR